MLNPTQAQALHDQILAAYFDDSEESLQIFEGLVAHATEHMSEQDWARLCLAIGWEKTGESGRKPSLSLQKRKTSIRLEIKPADCWFGVQWKRQAEILHIWICLLPCLPIHIQITPLHVIAKTA